MRAELGVAESGLERLVHAAYELLGLITFFTADRDKEAMARGPAAAAATAWDAAGAGPHGDPGAVRARRR